MSSRLFARAGLVAAAVVFSISLSIVVADPLLRGRPALPLPGNPAADFRLPTLDSNWMSLGALRGKVVVLYVDNGQDNIKRYLPDIADLFRDYRADPRVQPLSIFRNTEPADTDAERIRSELAAVQVEAPSLLDVASQVSRHYGVSKHPTLFVIDPAGVIRHRMDIRGASGGFVEMRTTIDSLLISPVATAKPK